MPIDYHIDHARRLVVTKGRGVFSDDDVFSYQRQVWSQPEVAGYDELVDMTAVEHIAIPSTKRIPELAELAANMDTSNQSSKMAIVAPQDLAFGLGRMFEVYRNLHANSTKKVQVCRAMREACAFLGVKGESLTTSKVSGPKHDLAFRRRGELLHHRRILSLPRGWRETPRSHAQRPPTDRRLP